MDATHPTSEKPLGLLAKGSRKTPSQQPQLYLNTVKISTTHSTSGLSSSLLMKTSCLRLKLVELNFFASFNADDQRKTYISNVSKYTYMHHMYTCVPHASLKTYVHHQQLPKIKIYLVGLPSALCERPGQNGRSVLNQLFLLLFRCFS